MRVLVLNCGSSSLKFQLVEVGTDGCAPPREQRRPCGSIAQIGDSATCDIVDEHGREHRELLSARTHEEAVRSVCAQLHGNGLHIDAVGHRIVHGGDHFTAATRIDAHVLADLDALSDLAPLHNPAGISGILAARAAFGAELPMVAVFDTAYHHTLPDYAATYALPQDLARRHRIRRYGFHGIAHASVVGRYQQVSGTPADHANLITLHLGNGCSAAAIRHGRSVDTSMGFTPLEGLMMGTRSGDLDPAIVSHLATREAVAADIVEGWLNQRSGLLGVSGRSNDMRDLIDVMDTELRARLAVDMFCYRASKYVGAYLAVLGGADAVLFSGGIGEHAPVIRARICERLRWCGLKLDAQRNAQALGTEARISSDDGLQAFVIPADEERLIAQETARCVRSGR